MNTPHTPDIEDRSRTSDDGPLAPTIVVEYRFTCGCGHEGPWRQSLTIVRADRQRHWDEGARWGTWSDTPTKENV